MRRPLAIAFVLMLATSLSPGAFAGPHQGQRAATGSSRGSRLPANPGLFLNVLPAGQGTTTTSADALQYEATGAVPPHDVDQQHMYDSLRVADLADLTDADLSTYFKPESFGVTGGVESTESPKDGVTVKRDSFGVPHITADSRPDAEWAAGWVAAEDRLFMMDTLRHVGAGRLSEFLGPSPSNLAMDRDMYLLAGYSPRELTDQGNALARYGPIGKQVIADDQNYVDGINARIQYDLQHPDQLPAEYPALQIQPATWTPGDIVAIATLIQAQFAGGGGNELGNALFLEQAIAKDGPKKARQLWQDLRAGDDPSSQVTADVVFDYEHPGGVNPASIAIPDPGSVHGYPIMSTTPSSGMASASGGTGASGRSTPGGEQAVLRFGPDGAVQHSLASVGLAMPDGMSNWLGVTAAKSASGHPVAVMGPQVSYFSPEILMEEDIHAPNFNARGAAFPGISQYVLLGRGRDFAWSATSGESDLIDTRAERLCNQDGSTPTVDSTGYVFNGKCRAMDTRDDQWLSKPTAADPSSLQPTLVTMHVRRTVHGPVFATGMVDGHPVAFVTQRSTFFHEVDTALPFAQLPTAKVHDVQSFLHVMNGVTGSFNWLYTDDRDLGYLHSGLYPERKPGMSTYLPTWGTGQWEWQGFLPFAQHPHEVNPPKGWIDSWNNRPAHGWNSSDAQWAWGPVHRVVMLQERLAARVPSGDVAPADLVSIMADAATVDLRGDQDVPLALQILGSSSDPKVLQAEQLLSSWAAAGAHRVDRNGDGQYDDHAAVALMDAWWPRLAVAVLQPVLGPLTDE
ncbi:MAG TPA: penicillin acylase family protein, partial [Actinomycetota bacterium]|nr:penicillin acylase family protein [Actinomycetota bacterium]